MTRAASSDDVVVTRVRPAPEVRKWADRHGFSADLVARWVAFLPRPDELLDSLLHETPRYLRVNSLSAHAADLQERLEARGFELHAVESPHPRLSAFRLDASPFAPASTPEHLMGAFYLQDLASLTAPAALDPAQGGAVLDLAAAPGGKTTAIAELTRDRAPILAVEPDPARAAGLASNLRRLGVTSVAVKVARGEDVPLKHQFESVLLDAPCTGEGVIPRDPARRTGKLTEHARLARLQRRLVAHAARLVAPGGTLVYSTCTFAPEECEAIVAYAAGLGLVPEPLGFDSVNGVPLEPALAAAGEMEFGDVVRHARRAYPHRHGTLGFFVARLKRPVDDEAVAAAVVEAVPTAERVEVEA